MADEITPADGPRREYSGVTDVNAPEIEGGKGAKGGSSGGNGYMGGGGGGSSSGAGRVV